MKTYIIPATLEHAKEINDIRNHYILTSNAILNLNAEPAETRMDWLKSRQSKTPVFVVTNSNTNNGLVLGWGCLNFFGDKPGYQVTAEISLYLKPEIHGQGIGKLLLQKLVDTAKELGFHSVISRITAENTISVKLHEKLGFKQVAFLPEVGRKFDQWVSVIFYQKML